MNAVIEIDVRKPRLNGYARELGMGSDGASLTDELTEELYRTVFRNYWKNKFEPYYRGEVKVDGKRLALIELPKEYLPDGVLGMTDAFSTIWLRSDLDEKFGYGMRERVLRHEKAHVEDPTADEMTIRRRTNTVNLTPYSSN